MSSIDPLLSIGLGLGLAAACGFRVFVPLLAISLGALTGHIPLSPGFAWIGTVPAAIAFGTATGSGFLAHRLLGGHEWPSHHRGAVDGSEGWEHDRCWPDRQRQHAARL